MGAGLLQPTHIIFVIVIALLVFGPKRLPEMGRSIGHGIREFKDSIDGNGNDNRAPRRSTRPLPPTRGERARPRRRAASGGPAAGRRRGAERPGRSALRLVRLPLGALEQRARLGPCAEAGLDGAVDEARPEQRRVRACEHEPALAGAQRRLVAHDLTGPEDVPGPRA